MDRRGFLKGLGLVIGGVALEQAVPLGRVWSFPAKIVPLNIGLSGVNQLWIWPIPDTAIYYDPVAISTLKHNLPLLYQCAENRVVVDQLSDAGMRPDLRTLETVIRREYRILS